MYTISINSNYFLGVVEFSAWKSYFFGNGAIPFIIILTLFLLVALGKIFEDWFLAFWV
jgi:hypothetical protein